MTQTEQNNRWDYLKEAVGEDELERMIHELPSYKEYVKKYGASKKVYVQLVSLDSMLEAGHDIPAPGPSLEDEAIAKEQLAALETALTPKQKQVMDSLSAGFTSQEIAAENGYKSTGGVRYHRDQMRRKLRKINED